MKKILAFLVALSFILAGSFSSVAASGLDWDDLPVGNVPVPTSLED